MVEEHKERLPFKCVECGKELWAKRSLAMLTGMNSGHGSCMDCKTFMHLEEKDGEMIPERWETYLERVNG